MEEVQVESVLSESLAASLSDIHVRLVLEWGEQRGNARLNFVAPQLFTRLILRS